MRPYKVSHAPPWQDTWHALYYARGHWHEVRDSQGAVVVYPDAKTATHAAQLAAFTED
jgi:hypothetical protein